MKTDTTGLILVSSQSEGCVGRSRNAMSNENERAELLFDHLRLGSQHTDTHTNTHTHTPNPHKPPVMANQSHSLLPPLTAILTPRFPSSPLHHGGSAHRRAEETAPQESSQPRWS